MLLVGSRQAGCPLTTIRRAAGGCAAAVSPASYYLLRHACKKGGPPEDPVRGIAAAVAAPTDDCPSFCFLVGGCYPPTSRRLGH